MSGRGAAISTGLSLSIRPQQSDPRVGATEQQLPGSGLAKAMEIMAKKHPVILMTWNIMTQR